MTRMRLVAMTLPVALIASMVVMAWSVLPLEAASNPCAGKLSVDHQRKLARMEDATIAANLVKVRGYCYVDISKGELGAILASLQKFEQRVGVDDLFAAVSAHSIVASDPAQNTAVGSMGPETGFLELYSFTDAPPAGIDEQLASGIPGTPDGTLEIGGTKVFRRKDPEHPESLWYYSWVRHGVQGVVDGADKAPLERWLQQYLAVPVLVGSETSALSSVLRPASGYAYANYVDYDVTKQFVTAPLGPIPSSTHQIADEQGAAGGLILAQLATSLTAPEYAAKLQRHGLQGFTNAGSEVIGTTPVEHLASASGQAYVWVRDGIAGVFLTAFPERTTAFLEAFLA